MNDTHGASSATCDVIAGMAEKSETGDWIAEAAQSEEISNGTALAS